MGDRLPYFFLHAEGALFGKKANDERYGPEAVTPVTLEGEVSDNSHGEERSQRWKEDPPQNGSEGQTVSLRQMSQAKPKTCH